jgi:hypothetical protein
VIDENKAPFVPESETRASYHCPRTNCDGHFYLTPAELGRELVCEKCGLPITIGRGKSHSDARIPRNYRRGFQRVYAILTVVWVVLLLVTLPVSRLKFWQPEKWETLSDHAAKSADPWEQAAADYRRAAEHTAQESESKRNKLLWIANVVVLPPLIGYVALFYVVPWIYRGFRPGTQI